MATRMTGKDAQKKEEQERAERLRELDRRREETDRRTQELLESSRDLRRELRKAVHG